MVAHMKNMKKYYIQSGLAAVVALGLGGCASADHQSSPQGVATAYMRDVLHGKARSAVELTHAYAVATPKEQAALRHKADRRANLMANKVVHDLSKDGGVAKTTVDKVEPKGKNAAVLMSITMGDGKVSKIIVFTSRLHGKWYCDYIL